MESSSRDRWESVGSCIRSENSHEKCTCRIVLMIPSGLDGPWILCARFPVAKVAICRPLSPSPVDLTNCPKPLWWPPTPPYLLQSHRRRRTNRHVVHQVRLRRRRHRRWRLNRSNLDLMSRATTRRRRLTNRHLPLRAVGVDLLVVVGHCLPVDI